MSSNAAWLPIFKSMETFPYYLSQYFWESPYFFKMHFDVFAERVMTFLTHHLPLNNLLTAWQKIYRLMNVYQKQTAALDDGDLLRHVVYGVTADEGVRNVLCGRRMEKLLDGLRGSAAEGPATHLVKYCVMREAEKLSALRDDSAAELARLGETCTRKVDEEFCAVFGLDSCTMDQYATFAVIELDRDPAVLLTKYREHSSLPANKYDDRLVASRIVGAHRSAKAYSMLGPCAPLDEETCFQVANMLNPQPHRDDEYNFVKYPGLDVCYLLFSTEMVFFAVELFDEVPKMNVCFFGGPGSAPLVH